MQKPVNLVIEEARRNIAGAVSAAISENPVPASVLKMIIAELAQAVIGAADQQIQADMIEYEKSITEEGNEDGTEH